MMKKMVGGLLAMAAIGTALPACAEDAQGQWSGAIGGELAVVLNVSKADNGSWQATFASPSQGFSTTVEQFASDATHLSFSIARLNASYKAIWDEQARAWAGSWTQGRAAPLNLKRASAASVARLQPRRPQEESIAATALPYDSREVRFASAGATLAGSLTLPKGAGPWPAVVLVHGSGPNTRDQDVFGHKVLLVLADYLTRQGIAVLRYDKRGVGESRGDYASATTLDFADDAQAAVAFLRTRPEIETRRIGMVGHSEGGLIAPMVAARDPQVGFVVMMAGPGVRGELLMVEQMALSAEAAGIAADRVAGQRKLYQALFAAIVAEPDAEQARRKATVMLQRAEDDGVMPHGVAAPMVKQFTNPWFRTFFTLEPGPALRAMDQPVLVLNGELDRQVPPKLDLDAIRTALVSNPRAVIRELPKLNHLFQTATTGAAVEYAQIEETLAPSALAVIGDWIRGQVQ
ncbi:alpha/beta fold hydrolase [Janthinobacterium sp.]|uniref:alpha/beta hydrolase n=1 Tax=Janthinobacterium sp. TaxID=1871054 RepID=UPI00262087CB|nr:alpha/beta fold hydrolase [Janthinobacterium sp.]